MCVWNIFYTRWSFDDGCSRDRTIHDEEISRVGTAANDDERTDDVWEETAL